MISRFFCSSGLFGVVDVVDAVVDAVVVDKVVASVSTGTVATTSVVSGMGTSVVHSSSSGIRSYGRTHYFY